MRPSLGNGNRQVAAVGVGRNSQVDLVQADRAALLARQDELEHFMLATEATTWPEAAAKARYLIQLYAATPDGQDPRRQKLIASAIAELDRLCEQ